jgi:hypothetical protein
MCQNIKDSGRKCDDETSKRDALRGECYKALKTTFLQCKCPEGAYDHTNHTKYLCVCVSLCVWV